MMRNKKQCLNCKFAKKTKFTKKWVCDFDGRSIQSYMQGFYGGSYFGCIMNKRTNI